MTAPATGHDHHHPHEHHDHGHHDHGDHGHGDHGHGHGHEHPTGLKGFLHEVFVPHSHDPADAIDDAMEASARGVSAVRTSLIVLGATAVVQLVIVLLSGSVALLADTVHNFSDALTAVPLWIAFVLGRRAATRRYTYGFGRAEDLAGLFVLAMIALSAIVAGVESIRRLFNPQPLDNLGWVLAAGIVGFIGNEAVALYRIRTGRRIGSAALVADGVHARTDGFTSLAVVLGVIGVWLGYPLADPIIGLVITVAIAVLLWGTAREVLRRLLDGVDPELVHRAEHALASVPGEVTGLRMRWTGHRLAVQVRLALPGHLTVADLQDIVGETEHVLRHAISAIDTVDVSTDVAEAPVEVPPA